MPKNSKRKTYTCRKCGVRCYYVLPHVCLKVEPNPKRLHRKNPTPEQIAKRTEVIRRNWSEADYAVRQGLKLSDYPKNSDGSPDVDSVEITYINTDRRRGRLGRGM